MSKGLLDEVWMPRLIAAWRRLAGRPGAATSLDAREVREVGDAVCALSQGLIGERELIGRAYMDDAAHLGAYLLYFWPVSYMQASRVLGHIAHVALWSKAPVLDLGSGPGPVAMAAVDAGAHEIELREKTQRGLDVALRLARDAGVKASGMRQDLQRLESLEANTYSVITMGHMLGELWSLGDSEQAIAQRVELCARLMDALVPGGHLVIMEPALRETSREMLRVRDALIEAGHGVKAPCYYKGACPALGRERDWCHAEFSWQMPRLVSQIAQAAGRRKERLKMSYVIFEKGLGVSQSCDDPNLFRLVSEPLHTKGRFHFMGCGARGRVGLTLLKRDRTPQNKAWIKKERWRVVRATSLTEHSSGELRLDRESVVEEVADPFGPMGE